MPPAQHIGAGIFPDWETRHNRKPSIDIGNIFMQQKIDMNRKDTLLKKIYTMLHLLGFHKKDSALL